MKNHAGCRREGSSLLLCKAAETADVRQRGESCRKILCRRQSRILHPRAYEEGIRCQTGKDTATPIEEAHFPLHKTLEEFDLSRLQHIRPEFVKQLAVCTYIDRHENLVLMGNPGTGKTHLMTVLGIKACCWKVVKCHCQICGINATHLL